ncbi:DUF2178 domain-containing protein [Thermococcus barophilus]|uniref:DUF2178 domain-containing protein n=1 Tax=Thermococcus barophilus (strain DSM 11836 / MP) TaxID=391623 RepID=F0LIE8_THEBM|nr:DUF2178 domain-containing protein [Thermococcus barophilus]ADT84478.1 hypothetical protein TERMP_01503 [Thermococcus barophilus MP]
MNEAIVNFIIWAFLATVTTLILLHLSKRDEKKKTLIPAMLVILTMGYLMGYAVSNGNLPLAFSVFLVGGIMLNLYYASMKRRGYVLEDERTLRIEEISARRTLQVFMIGLAFAVIYLSVAQQRNPALRDAFILAESLLVFLFFTHLAFKIYYSRVM